MRGADVAFYGYQRLPPGPVPRDHLLSVVPDLVFEVRSPSDRWSAVLAKMTEYLEAGVTTVCVVDPESETILVYRDNELPRTLHNSDELTLPEVLGEFRLPPRRLFASGEAQET